MFDPVKLVREFHEKHGCGAPDKISDGKSLSSEMIGLRRRLIVEEFGELLHELYGRHSDSVVRIVNGLYAGQGVREEMNIPQVVKETCDLIYVLAGLLVQLGIPDLETAFRAVHESNMSKDAVPGHKGKVMKGENYRPPNIEEILRRYEEGGLFEEAA